MTADMDAQVFRKYTCTNGYFINSYCNHMIFIKYPFVQVYFLKTWADGYFLFL